MEPVDFWICNLWPAVVRDAGRNASAASRSMHNTMMMHLISILSTESSRNVSNSISMYKSDTL